jgi:hypothetical protein
MKLKSTAEYQLANNKLEDIEKDNHNLQRLQQDKQ